MDRMVQIYGKLTLKEIGRVVWGSRSKKRNRENTRVADGKIGRKIGRHEDEADSDIRDVCGLSG